MGRAPTRGPRPGAAQGAKELYGDALAVLGPSDSERAIILVNRAMVHKKQVCQELKGDVPPHPA